MFLCQIRIQVRELRVEVLRTCLTDSSGDTHTGIAGDTWLLAFVAKSQEPRYVIVKGKAVPRYEIDIVRLIEEAQEVRHSNNTKLHDSMLNATGPWS